jgi:nucleoside-diphosphate-sugar epimerase
MKAFVTGGAGFIGSHLVDKLIEKGNIVTVFDDLSSGKKEFIKHHFENKDFNFIESDLKDKEKVEKEIKDHDIVFHIAANPDVRLGAKKPVIAKEDIVITYNLLDAMRKNDINKIVFSSSSTVYGETPPKPLPEDYGPLLPISVYGAAKLASEGLISSFCHTFDMKSWVVKIENITFESKELPIEDFLDWFETFKIRDDGKSMDKIWKAYVLKFKNEENPGYVITSPVLKQYNKSNKGSEIKNMGDLARSVSGLTGLPVSEIYEPKRYKIDGVTKKGVFIPDDILTLSKKHGNLVTEKVSSGENEGYLKNKINDNKSNLSQQEEN